MNVQNYVCGGTQAGGLYTKTSSAFANSTAYLSYHLVILQFAGYQWFVPSYFGGTSINAQFFGILGSLNGGSILLMTSTNATRGSNISQRELKFYKWHI